MRSNLTKQANAGNKELMAALEKVENVLSMKIGSVTEEKLKLFKPR